MGKGEERARPSEPITHSIQFQVQDLTQAQADRLQQTHIVVPLIEPATNRRASRYLVAEIPDALRSELGRRINTTRTYSGRIDHYMSGVEDWISLVQSRMVSVYMASRSGNNPSSNLQAVVPDIPPPRFSAIADAIDNLHNIVPRPVSPVPVRVLRANQEPAPRVIPASQPVEQPAPQPPPVVIPTPAPPVDAPLVSGTGGQGAGRRPGIGGAPSSTVAPPVQQPITDAQINGYIGGSLSAEQVALMEWPDERVRALADARIARLRALHGQLTASDSSTNVTAERERRMNRSIEQLNAPYGTRRAPPTAAILITRFGGITNLLIEFQRTLADRTRASVPQPTRIPGHIDPVVGRLPQGILRGTGVDRDNPYVISPWNQPNTSGNVIFPINLTVLPVPTDESIRFTAHFSISVPQDRLRRTGHLDLVPVRELSRIVRRGLEHAARANGFDPTNQQISHAIGLSCDDFEQNLLHQEFTFE